MTTAPTYHSTTERLSFLGRLVLTSGVQNWIDTGVAPYADEPTAMSIEWRRHTVAVLFTSHASGDQLDCCDEDHRLNQEVFHNPGCGDRIVSVFDRMNIGKMYCITDAYGTPDAITTILFSAEY